MSDQQTRCFAGAVSLTFTIPVRTKNPNNGATGHTRLAAILRSRDRKVQRETARAHALGHAVTGTRMPCTVVLTRVAPSGGLDPHDGLGAALKGIIDGVADALGLTNDRDPRVRWVLGQRRGKRGEYAVEVEITPANEAAQESGPVANVAN